MRLDTIGNATQTNYTNFLRRLDRKASGSALHDAGYEQFCKEVVDVLDKQITFMSHLYSYFVKIVQRVEGLDASDFRRFRLKERLTHIHNLYCYTKATKLCSLRICVQPILWEMIMIGAVIVMTTTMTHYLQTQMQMVDR